jgi:hypothetical protein
MSLAWPRREHKYDPGVADGTHRASLVRGEVGEQPSAAALSATVLGDLDLATNHDEVRALVHLMLLEFLAGRQLDRNRSRLLVGAQDLRMMWLNRE